VDEVIGIVAEQIAKRLQEAQQRATAAQSAAAAGNPMPAGGGKLGPRQAMRVNAVRQPPPRPAPPPTPAAPASSTGTVLAAVGDVFGPGALSSGLDPAAPAPSALLAAFSGSSGLLAGIILSEALAPPLALRPHGHERD